jgi:hypothetical protein
MYLLPWLPSESPTAWWRWFKGGCRRDELPSRDGLACYWFVLIQEDHADNGNLIRHEFIHIDQMQREPLRVLGYLWKYYTSARHRALYEMEAYKIGSLMPGSAISRILQRSYNVPQDIAFKVTGYR